MSKTLKTQSLNSRPIVRTLVAVSLSISLAAFGCTTDRTLGNGDPVVTPGVRTSPTGSTSTGSETPATPQPMFSSSFDNGQALPAVTPRASRADQAAAIMSQYAQSPRVRYLGPAMPGNSGRGYHSDSVVTGAFQNPALRANPQLTVNSSISSSPTPVIASGAGEGAGGDALAAGAFVSDGSNFAAVTGASTVNTGFAGTAGTAGGTTVAGTGLTAGGNTGAAPIFATPATTGTVTSATGLPLGTLAATATPTTAPTAFSALNPPTTISSFPALAANSTVTQAAVADNANAATGTGLVIGGNTNSATTNNTTTNTSTATTARTRSGLNAVTTGGVATGTAVTNNTTNATATSGRATTNTVRMSRDGNGRIVITNQNAQRR